MAVNGLLVAIQARAAARGMTLAALARASGMQPSNLRRMLKNSSASPQLGSVMRLLEPLRARIGPAAAAAPGELAAFLDGLRRRRGLRWEQLLEPGDVHGARLASAMMPNPERLPLELVMRIADALEVPLVLVDADAPAAPAGSATPRRSRARGADTESDTPRVPSPESSTAPGPARSEPPARASLPRPDAPRATASGLPPLRPPRLGRYRDAPPGPVPPRSRPEAWRSSRPHALEVALLERISTDDLRAVLATMSDSFATLKSVPLSMAAGLARLVEVWLDRRRAPAEPDPEPPPGCFDALDPTPLWQVWQASKRPGYQATDSAIWYDRLGMVATHLALDASSAVSIRLAARGHAPRLLAVLSSPTGGTTEVLSRPDVPLEIHVDGELRAFDHVRAGPVFGELAVGSSVYLLAAVSALLVLIVGQGDTARVVWGGRPEKLKEVMVEMVSSPEEGQEEASLLNESAAALDELRAQLATAQRRCAELEAARATAELERVAGATSRRAAEDALEAEREARRTTENALAAARAELDEEAARRAVLDQTAAESLGKLMALVATRTQELAAESELRAAAEARGVQAEQERDALASEVAELFRLLQQFEQQTHEQDRRTDAKLADMHAKIQTLQDAHQGALAGAAEPPPAKRAKDLSRKWRR